MGEHNGVWPLEQHQKEIRLSLVQALGEDFFFMPGSAAMPPEPNVLALGFTNGTWSIKLASPVAKTNAVAVVVLASDFKIIKASRSDK
jgi:hypothetical protein